MTQSIPKEQNLLKKILKNINIDIINSQRAKSIEKILKKINIDIINSQREKSIEKNIEKDKYWRNQWKKVPW